MIARLPQRRKRPRMNARALLQKIWPRHRRWVKSHGCCVDGCQQLPIEFSHLRTAANAGMKQKPHDTFGVPMCGPDVSKGQEGHHGEYHRVGHDSFERKYDVDLFWLARMFTKLSVDTAMKESLALVELENA